MSPFFRKNHFWFQPRHIIYIQVHPLESASKKLFHYNANQTIQKLLQPHIIQHHKTLKHQNEPKTYTIPPKWQYSKSWLTRCGSGFSVRLKFSDSRYTDDGLPVRPSLLSSSSSPQQWLRFLSATLGWESECAKYDSNRRPLDVAQVPVQKRRRFLLSIRFVFLVVLFFCESTENSQF